MTDNVNGILYTGFIEELVDVLQVKDEKLMVKFNNLYTFMLK